MALEFRSALKENSELYLELEDYRELNLSRLKEIQDLKLIRADLKTLVLKKDDLLYLKNEELKIAYKQNKKNNRKSNILLTILGAALVLSVINN